MDIVVVDGKIVQQIPVTKAQLLNWYKDAQERLTRAQLEVTAIKAEIAELKAIYESAAIVAVKEVV